MKTVELTRGFVARVSDEDWEKVSQFKWRAQSLGNGKAIYAGRTVHEPMICGKRKSKTVLLHRFLMGEPEGQVVDHINGDPLDCLRSNLRVCSRQQNCQNQGLASDNTTGYKGISLKTGNRLKNPRWGADIRIANRTFHIGYYDTPVQAAKAYNAFAALLFGEFARLNSMLQGK